MEKITKEEADILRDLVDETETDGQTRRLELESGFVAFVIRGRPVIVLDLKATGYVPQPA